MADKKKLGGVPGDGNNPNPNGTAAHLEQEAKRAAAFALDGGPPPAEPRLHRKPDPEFALLARIDRMLCEVDSAVGDRILSMLMARRFGLPMFSRETLAKLTSSAADLQEAVERR